MNSKPTVGNDLCESQGERVLIWSFFIRFFHWTLVLGFTAAYLTAEFGYDEIHSWLGYYITILLFLRIVWGFIGSEYARFRSFSYPVKETYLYFKSVINQKPKHYLGHNPLGALMVFTLLGMLMMLVLTGLIYLTWGEFEGPFWAMGIVFEDWVGSGARWLHYVLPEVILFFILLHVCGVFYACWQDKENLIASMWHGLKKMPKA